MRTIFMIIAIIFGSSSVRAQKSVIIGGDTTFQKVRMGEIVTDREQSVSATIGDFNGDGFLDIFSTNLQGRGSNGVNLVYYGDGNGMFRRSSPEEFPRDGFHTYGASAADYDNDGDLDLFVPTLGTDPSRLYINDGNKGFVGRDLHVAESFNCVWFDVNNDGWLDLFVGNGGDDPAKDWLYFGSKDGLLRPEMLGYSHTINGVAPCDFDNDGDTDLFVATDSDDWIYVNDGGQLHREVPGQIKKSGESSFGGSWGDYDNDGDMDLFVTNFCTTDGRYPGTNILFRNDNGKMVVVKKTAVSQEPHSSYAACWGDYDNDGDVDLFVANRYESCQLFRNDSGVFVELIGAYPANGDAGYSHGAGWLDFDNDGDLDLFVANGFGHWNFLYRNTGNRNAWLEVKLRGTVSNRDGIGAKIRILSIINGVAVWQMREVVAQSGYVSQMPFIQHFGLGGGTVMEVIVEWPSGHLTNIKNVPTTRRLITIHEE